VILGLGDDASAPNVEAAEELANMFGASIPVGASQSISTPLSTITIYPPTLAPAPRAPGVGSSFLDSVLPKKVGTDGKEKIWGLPPAVAYAIAGVILVGGGMMVVQAMRGGRRVATNPKRRKGSRKKRARYKR
jgi:hypothetical protein